MRNKHQKRNADGKFAPDLIKRVKKSQRKAPKAASIPVDHIDNVYLPPARVRDASNIDPKKITPTQAGTIAGLMESAMATPTNEDERQFINHQRKMLENVFGPINWDK